MTVIDLLAHFTDSRAAHARARAKRASRPPLLIDLDICVPNIYLTAPERWSDKMRDDQIKKIRIERVIAPDHSEPLWRVRTFLYEHDSFTARPAWRFDQTLGTRLTTQQAINALRGVLSPSQHGRLPAYFDGAVPLPPSRYPPCQLSC
jgi:hypothetical protein